MDERNFSIYSILREAPEDQPQQQNQDANNDNFDIDTSLDNIDQELDNATGDAPGGENQGGDDLDLGGEPDDGGGDLGGGDMGEEDEPVSSNTDFFSSLTAEEQAIKITQLKKQYMTLYNSCDELLEKISNIETDENNIYPISRINNTLESLKTYIADSLYHKFAKLSYYENDVMFNRFLSIFKSINTILEEVYKDMNRINLQNQH